MASILFGLTCSGCVLCVWAMYLMVAKEVSRG